MVQPGTFVCENLSIVIYCFKPPTHTGFLLIIFAPIRSHREEMVLSDMQVKPGEAWEYCPREALRQVSEILKKEFNLVITEYSFSHIQVFF